ncbi:MAG: prepilin-type N-terminal cleavage/methylation domain-containing protein [Phycisphaerae bacterium]
MSDAYRIIRFNRGFTLLELIAALVIGSTVLVAIIGVYNQMQMSVQTLERKFQGGGLGEEVLQRIAEDLDKISAPAEGNASDTAITIKNKYDQLYRSAQMVITKSYFDTRNQKQTFEQIIWQSNYDFDANSLILYRSHRGITTEDMLLDSEKDDWQRELFVPIVSGLSYFSIEVPKGDEMLNSWSETALPSAVTITLSFGKTYSSEDGVWDVEEDDKIIRTIAIDRARQIKFVYIPPGIDPNDINDFLLDVNDFNDFNDLAIDEDEFLEPDADEMPDGGIR